jgi:hypothetical protein
MLDTGQTLEYDSEIPVYRRLDPEVLAQLNGYFQLQINDWSDSIEHAQSVHQSKVIEAGQINVISNPLRRWMARINAGDSLTDYETRAIQDAQKQIQILNGFLLQLNPRSDGQSRTDEVERFLGMQIRNSLKAANIPESDMVARQIHRDAISEAEEAAKMLHLINPKKAESYLKIILNTKNRVSFLDGPEIVE